MVRVQHLRAEGAEQRSDVMERRLVGQHRGRCRPLEVERRRLEGQHRGRCRPLEVRERDRTAAGGAASWALSTGGGAAAGEVESDGCGVGLLKGGFLGPGWVFLAAVYFRMRLPWSAAWAASD